MTNTNLSQCPKCKEEIQIGAKKCKHCGADLRNWFIKHWIITFLIICGFLWFIMPWAKDGYNKEILNNNQNTEINQKVVIEKNAIQVNARELYAEYEENEIQADSKYKGQLIRVLGTIENIGKDILDNPYIALKTDNIIGSVQCMLADGEEWRAAQLKKENSITLEGKLSWKLGNILIRNCKIID